MTDAEIKTWLGLPAGARMRDMDWWARVLAGMADTPAPDGTSYRQLVIFRAFLACARPLPGTKAREQKQEKEEWWQS